VRSMRWICNKHDKILELTELNGNETIEELVDKLKDINSYANDAKSDGEKMENGLSEKRKKIEQLESEIERLNNKIEELERRE
jgi:peptidoglycan hydrolase CwlO-like protein